MPIATYRRAGYLRPRTEFTIDQLYNETDEAWVSKIEKQVKPFDASEQRRARAFVKIEKMNRAYLDFIATLRERYPVEVYWQELEKLRGKSG